jgi:D-glycero-alpha-D-manno-heptose-7-phosphate kinase
MLIYTSNIRDSEKMLSKVKESEEQLRGIEQIGRESAKCIIEKDYYKLGELMDTHWTLKKTISPDMSSPDVDELYKNAKRLGAIGGKLVGAGGGGFLMLVVPDDRVRMNILQSGCFEQRAYVPFKLTHTGTEVIVNDS